MANTIAGNVVIPKFNIRGNVLKGSVLTGTFGIPMMSVHGQIIAGDVSGTLTISLPLVQFSLSGGMYLDIKLPRLSLSVIGSSNNVGILKIKIPSIQFSITSIQQGLLSLQIKLPVVQLSLSGMLAGIGVLSFKLPSLKFNVVSALGCVGSLSVTLPSLILRMDSFWTGRNTLSFSLPKVIVSLRLKSNDIFALSFNVKNFALTEYDNTYDYNSMSIFNGKLIGSRKDGIYILSGESDNGTSIEWSLKTGKIDIEDGMLKKLRYAWLSYRPSGDLILIVDDGEMEYEYQAESVKQIDGAVRIKFGKGFRNRYLQFELKNVSDEKVFVDRLRLFGDPIVKKR
jgi:hypothetical protein